MAPHHNKIPLAPTDEQQSIMDATKCPDSLFVRAYAGTGKTTTLALASQSIRSPALALAFNKSIAQEFSGRFPSHFKCQTLNGFGFGALMKALPNISKFRIEDRKSGKIISELAKNRKMELTSDQWDAARQLLSAAMQAGITPGDIGDPLVPDTSANWRQLADQLWMTEDDFDLLADLTHEALEQQVALTRQGIINFDDQVYHSTCIDGRFPQYPNVFVDEAQDLSPLNHRMIVKGSRADAKLLICGDPKQAIYAFRGADSRSMDSLRQLRARWLDRPLAITFRCPKRIVERQQGHAPGYRAWHTNPEGRVDRLDPELDSNGAISLRGWGPKTLLGARQNSSGVVAILCRNNGPLFALAFKIIRAGYGVKMRGSEIGKGLTALSRKLSSDDMTPIEQFLGKLAEWRDLEINKAQVLEQDGKIAGINDRAECLEAVADNTEVRTVGDLRKMIERLFATEAAQIELSSIHKAKGLEWDTVLHLDPWRIPSKWAREAAQDGDTAQLDQEWNLKYVAETRTKHTLLEANLKTFEADK